MDGVVPIDRKMVQFDFTGARGSRVKRSEDGNLIRASEVFLGSKMLLISYFMDISSNKLCRCAHGVDRQS